MKKNLISFCRALLPAGCFAICSAILPVRAQTPNAQTTGQPAATNAPVSQKRHSPYRPGIPRSAQNYYASSWGVDMLSVKAIDSGMMVRFNYRVLDAKKAEALNDKKSAPYLVDERARVKLVVPNLEKVGELRNKATPEPGKVYWMVFSNKGDYVKPGDRVSVEIGKFRVDGLLVE